MKRLLPHVVCLWLSLVGSWAVAAQAPSSLLPPPNDYNFIHPPSIACGDQTADLSYKVPLSPQDERRAMAVYRKAIVIVSHVHCVEPSDFDEMQKAGITAVVLKLDIDGINMLNGRRSYGVPGEDWFARGTKAFRRINEMAAQPGSKILVVRRIEDLYRAKREGKVGLILGFEGALALEGNLENVKRFYDLGMREMQPWFASPNPTKTADGKRLSSFGAGVIGEMNRLGILLDVELMDGEAFAQAVALAKPPVYISHTSVSVAALDRKAGSAAEPYNADQLNDATIRAIAATGGTMGMHFLFPNYITARHGTVKATLADLSDHIVYVRDLVGVDHVSLGVDFFPETGFTLIAGAGRMIQFPNVAREMVRRGFRDEEISKVLGGNLVRVFEASWKR